MAAKLFQTPYSSSDPLIFTVDLHSRSTHLPLFFFPPTHASLSIPSVPGRSFICTILFFPAKLVSTPSVNNPRHPPNYPFLSYRHPFGVVAYETHASSCSTRSRLETTPSPPFFLCTAIACPYYTSQCLAPSPPLSYFSHALPIYRPPPTRIPHFATLPLSLSMQSGFIRLFTPPLSMPNRFSYYPSNKPVGPPVFYRPPSYFSPRAWSHIIPDSESSPSVTLPDFPHQLSSHDLFSDDACSLTDCVHLFSKITLCNPALDSTRRMSHLVCLESISL